LRSINAIDHVDRDPRHLQTLADQEGHPLVILNQ
jgi:hypothetical protein